MTKLESLPPSWADEIETAMNDGYSKRSAMLKIINALLASGKARVEDYPVVIEGGMYTTVKRLVIELE